LIADFFTAKVAKEREVKADVDERVLLKVQ